MTNVRTWKPVGGTADWRTASNWQEGNIPDQLSDVLIKAVGPAEPLTIYRGPVIETEETAYRVTVEGELAKVTVDEMGTLTVFGETLLANRGEFKLQGGKLDAQFVNIVDGGQLSGSGDIFVGTGPISGAVRNLSGTVAPSPILGDSLPMRSVGTLSIEGDYSSLEEATLAIDIVRDLNTLDNDLVEATRFAFLAGSLDVSYTGLTDLTIGDEFTILTAGEGVVGEFDSLLLPSDYTWDVNYLANSVVLEVIGLGLAGDYNGDGQVDAADYAVIREGLGTAYTSADIQTWKANYGATSGSGAGSVPEPASLVTLLLVTLTLSLHRSSWRAGGR